MEPTMVQELVRRIVIAFLFLTHIHLATFLIGIFSIAVGLEFFSIVAPDNPNLRRVAYGLGRTATIMYSTGAVLAFMVMFFLAIFFPSFWYTVLRINFWPFFLEALTFVLTVLYLFPWYFTWRGLENFRWAHLSLGAALIIAAYFQQSLIDVVASYMLTPAPPDVLLRVFFNPTTIPLDMHRVLGNISFAGFVIAGYAAFRSLRAKEEVDHRYYDWLGSIMLIAGVTFMFLQPAVGIEYVQEIRANSPGAFNAMMRGHNAWLFLVQVVALSILFIGGMYYMFLQVRKSRRSGAGTLRVMLIIAVVSGIVLAMPRVIGPSMEYPWLYWENPIGSMQPWKYLALAGLTVSSIISSGVYVGAYRKGLRWGFEGLGGRRAQKVLLVVAIFGSFMMFWMGYIRENSRTPYLIYNEQSVSQPEVFPEVKPTVTPATPGPSSSVPGGGLPGGGG